MKKKYTATISYGKNSVNVVVESHNEMSAGVEAISEGAEKLSEMNGKSWEKMVMDVKMTNFKKG